LPEPHRTQSRSSRSSQVAHRCSPASKSPHCIDEPHQFHRNGAWRSEGRSRLLPQASHSRRSRSHTQALIGLRGRARTTRRHRKPPLPALTPEREGSTQKKPSAFVARAALALLPHGRRVERPHSNTLRAVPFDCAKSRLGDRDRHVVGHHWLGEAFEGECAELFGCDASL